MSISGNANFVTTSCYVHFAKNSLWNEFRRNIAYELFSNLQLNYAESYLQERIWYKPANVGVQSANFHAGNVNKYISEKQNEAWPLNWQNTTRTFCLKIFYFTKTVFNKTCSQSCHGFEWGCAHVLHHKNSYHKPIFFKSLYINLETKILV